VASWLGRSKTLRVVSPGPGLTRRRFLAGLVTFAASSRSRAGEAPEGLSGLVTRELDGAVRWASGVGARLGACFVDLESGLELGGAAAGVAENPASNEKLVTAGTLLRNLGGQRTFATGLYGRIAAGRVAELVLRGEGDPSLTSADLVALAGALRARGAQRVGKVLVDQSAFDDQFVPPGFEQQPNEWAAFRAPVSAVAVDRNSVLVAIDPTTSGTPAHVLFQPDGFVETDGKIGTGPRGKALHAAAGLAARGDHLVAHLAGAVAEGSAPLHYRQRVEDPRLLAGYALRSALAQAGIVCDGALELGGASERAELCVHRSRPLAELLPELGKNSDNFYAETLLKAVGGAVRGFPATSAAGAELALAWLKEIGAYDAGTRVTNGSGLFDTNRLSPRTLTSVLASAWHDPAIGSDFVSQLAVGGVDGTLKQRFASQAARRAVVAKTGTLNDVVALSGYVVAPNQPKSVAFSFIASNLRGRLTGARQHIDHVVEAVADELWRGTGRAATSG
jgi:D-alanyl-D-alanine carboxypeptidase/D-alanyl-D-alanine-endopeptidase (penicillin-binding protein 4)